MKHKLKKIELIDQHIAKLEAERAEIKAALPQLLLDVLIKKNALQHDFETLVGGLIHTLHTLTQNDEGAQKMHHLWKKEGLKFLSPSAKTMKAKIA